MPSTDCNKIKCRHYDLSLSETYQDHCTSIGDVRIYFGNYITNADTLILVYRGSEAYIGETNTHLMH